MNSLGIYFGPQLISIVESKGNKTVNYIQVMQGAISSGNLLEEKVPLPVKLIAMLKDELVKNNVEANEAVLSISGKDLIVRTFEMPILPQQELAGAVNFEVKKYIPFKIEDLISDFQFSLDKTIKKTRVLFVGIKKDVLDNHISILDQLGIKIRGIEYCAFSILRLLKLANVKEKGIIAVVNVDITKEDEVNFVVLEKGFPLFSRDISLIGTLEEPARPDESQGPLILEKLKREIQISLDYYDRKFPGKSIAKIFFITNPEYQADFDGFVKELSLGASFIDVSKHIDRPIPFSLPFVKAYSSSLFKIDTSVKINLLLAKERVARKAGIAASKPLSLVIRFKPDIVTASVCFFFLGAVFLSGLFRLLPLQRSLSTIISVRPQVGDMPGGTNYKELVTLSSDYKARAEAMSGIAKSRLYVTPLLDAIPRVVPKDIRLSNVSLKEDQDKTELILEGSVHLGDSDREIALVNTFLSQLKENDAFSRYFKEMSVISTRYKQLETMTVTNFTIACRNYKKDKAIK